MTFYINADISQQFTLDNRKVLHLYDSKLDVEFPIVAWIEGEVSSHDVTREGKSFNSGLCYKFDIVTRPKVQPLIIFYTNVYEAWVSNPYKTLLVADKALLNSALSIVKTTYDPNNNTTYSEVLTKEDKL